MDPGPDEAAMEWQFGTESTEPSEADAGAEPTDASPAASDGGSVTADP